MSTPKHDWQHCASSGDDYLHSDNTRIRRMNFHNAAPLYIPEYWGTYGLEWPLRGPTQETLKGAQRWLHQQKRKYEAQR